MKKLIAASLAVAFVLAGCQEEQFGTNTDPNNYQASVEAFDSGTRTSLSEGNKVVWSSQDQIAIFDSEGAGKGYRILDSYVGNSFGEFSRIEGVTTAGSATDIDRTVAIYPFRENLSISSAENGSYKIEGITFPSEQIHTRGSFSDEAFPMAALSPAGSKSLSFKNIGGVLKLSLKGSYAVSRINIKGNSGERLSGTATVTLNSEGIPSVQMSSDTPSSVSLICDPAVQLNSENGTEFYISIPPTEFEAGFTITVTDTEGNTYRKTTSLANPVSRSCIHSMPATDLTTDISDEATENYIDLGFGRNAQIISYDEATGALSLSYSSDVPYVEDGKAFVLPIELGSGIRVIDSHSISGLTLNLQTSEGNMCDLFKNTSFTLSTSGEPDTRSAGEWDVITPAAYGYLDEDGVYHELYNTLTKAGDPPKYNSDMTLWSFTNDYGDTEIYSSRAGVLKWEKCKFEAGLNGTFRFDFGEKKISQIKSKGDVKYFSYEVQGNFDIDMLLAYEYEASYSAKEDKIIKSNIIPSIQFTFIVGTVPVLLQVDTDMCRELSFEVKGNIKASAGLKMGTNVKIGVEWTPENGVKPIRSFTTTNTLYDPTFEINASADAKVSYYPHIGIKLYKLVGPWFEPRPYLSEKINAEARVSAAGNNHIGWQAETSVGMDLQMGLELDFIIAKQDMWTQRFNDVVKKPIFTAPKRITRISPTQGTTIRKGQTVDAQFKVESYSPVTKKYYPCPAALVYFDSKDGSYSPQYAIADLTGMVNVKWTPAGNTATKATTEYNIKAAVINHNGEAIDETTLTVSSEESEQWVDLGLSVLWAGWNVGANSPEEPGSYYAWGETTEKSSYTWNNYRHAEEFICREYDKYGKVYEWVEYIGTFIGSDISSTSNDVAHIKWGDGARIPTYDEIWELYTKCTFESGTYNGVEGYYITGSNGNSIFLPYTGMYWPYNGDIDLENLNQGYFWLSTYDQDNRNNAFSFVINENTGSSFTYGTLPRAMGATIRPVRNYDGSDKPIEEDPENDGYDPEDNPFYEYGDGSEEGGDHEEGQWKEGQWVDLGLSVKWAGWNIGANSPEETGGYYAWGETEEKYAYLWDNYQFLNPDTFAFEFIGSDICGGEYDVAHMKWGNGARMPTMEEITELTENCTLEVAYYNNIRGIYVYGPNGNSIFLPLAGLYMDNDLQNNEMEGNIWSGTVSEIIYNENDNPYIKAYSLHYDDYMLRGARERHRHKGLPVRAVKD